MLLFFQISFTFVLSKADRVITPPANARPKMENHMPIFISYKGNLNNFQYHMKDVGGVADRISDEREDVYSE